MATPAGAVSQTAGDDVPIWNTGYSWTYATTFVVNTSAATATLTENETYTVAGIVAKDGYAQAYQVNISGNITGCSGSASGASIGSCTGTASGTAWYEVGNLALIEEDQDQNLTGKADGLVSLTASFNIALASTPGLETTDFRLHNGDTWQVSNNIAESGNYSYDASGISSGSGPITGTQPVNATASETSTTYNGTAVDQTSINDPTDGFSGTADWAPTDQNLAYLNLDMTSSGIDITQSLTSDNTPAPSSSLTESLSAPTTCAGAPITVSGTLSPPQSGVGVTVTTDLEPASPGDLVSTSTTSGAGGAYSATITAPVPSDNLQKAGIRGSYAVIVSTSAAKWAATLEVTTQDCTTTAYTGATSANQAGAANVSATVTDEATGGPVPSGTPVTFSLTGQSATVSATTNGSGVATAVLPIAGPPGNQTVTASMPGTTNLVTSSASSAFTVTKDATTTTISSSEPEATVGDGVTFTALVAPSGSHIATAPTGTVTFSVNGAQLGSPVAINAAGSATSQADSTLGLGPSTVTATYSGDGNYTGSSGQMTQQVHPPLTGTTTTLAAIPTSSEYGETVGLTATVGAQTGTPDGQVNFYDGDTLLGTADLNQTAGNDQATISVSNLPVGSDSLTAVYQGDDFVTFAGSGSSPVTEVVSLDPTTTSITLASPATTPVSGQALTYDVTVSANAPGAGTPTGTVQLDIDGSPIDTATLSGGAASFNVSGLGAGNHSVEAVYGGDPDFAGGTQTTAQTVDQADTTTVLETSPSVSVTGQAVTITATVTPAAPGAGNPTGLVTFYDGGTPIGTAALAVTSNGDQASIGLANLPQGTDTLTASYPGDTNFVGSTSAPYTQVVSAAPPMTGTTTVVASSANPSSFGQGVTYTATVTAADGTTPSGAVQFSVDGANLGAPVSLNAAGQATSPAIATLAPGAHTVVGAYGGALTPTDQYTVSGEVDAQTVQEDATSAALTVSPSPAAFGQPVSFTATLSAAAPGAGTPGGTVQFLVDGQDFGTPVAAAGGTATTTDATPLPAGTHVVSVITSGDPDFAGTTASANFSVGLIPTTTTLSGPSSANFGQAVTLHASVAAAQAGPAPVSGSVSFYDGTTLLGSTPVTVSGGTGNASLTVSNLAPGTHHITATYSGDANYAGSTSSTLSLTVNKEATSLSVTPAQIEEELLLTLPIVQQLTLEIPLQATLTTASGAPVANQPLTFTAGSTVLCTTTTNAQGQATCTPSLLGELAIVLNLGYSVSYAGNADYTSTSAAGKLLLLVL
ncbi:MAG TPA: Ig-like domain-containing protein [Acidimicrobiales bacterium]